MNPNVLTLARSRWLSTIGNWTLFLAPLRFFCEVRNIHNHTFEDIIWLNYSLVVNCIISQLQLSHNCRLAPLVVHIQSVNQVCIILVIISICIYNGADLVGIMLQSIVSSDQPTLLHTYVVRSCYCLHQYLVGIMLQLGSSYTVAYVRSCLKLAFN